jgi:hypothetical protein
MKLLKAFAKSFVLLVVLGTIMFILNVPGLVKCGGGIEPTNKSAYGSINGDQMADRGLAQSLN